MAAGRQCVTVTPVYIVPKCPRMHDLPQIADRPFCSTWVGDLYVATDSRPTLLEQQR